MTPPTARTAALERFWKVVSADVLSHRGDYTMEAALQDLLTAFESSLLEDLIERADAEGTDAAAWAAMWLSDQLPSPPLKEDQPTE